MLYKHYFKKLLGSRYRRFVNFSRILIWLFPVIFKLIFAKKTKFKRILIIYDLTTQPFSVGDILTVQEASLVLRENHQVDFIDFAVICDQESLKNRNKFFDKINSDNYFYHLSSILPVAQVNPFLGSVFAFNSYDQLDSYIVNNGKDLHVWPSGWKVKISREYLYYTIFEDLIYPYFLKNGRVPRLSSRKPLEVWAKSFYRQHSGESVSVTVNIRRNPFFQKDRNLNIDVWIEFFKFAEKKYKAKFFVVCAQSEIDNRLRSIPNVVIVKDFITNVEQDLALIGESAIHLGAPSGPATMVFFSDKPYLIVRGEMHLQHFSNSNLIRYSKENVQQFVFANEHQKFISGEESLEMLIDNFDGMWESLQDLNNRKVDQDFRVGDISSWLR